MKETSTNLIQAIKDKKAEKYRVKQDKIDARAKRETDRKKDAVTYEKHRLK